MKQHLRLASLMLGIVCIPAARAADPDRGAVLYDLAVRKERARASDQAVSLLKECLTLQEGFGANSWSEDAGRSELLQFNAIGSLLGRYALEDAQRHGFNDLVVRRNGDVILTDSLSNQVLRFDRTTMAFAPLTFHRALAEPNGIAITDDERQLFVADDWGVLRLTLQSGASQDVIPGSRNTLAGIDGLYWHRDALIGIQNAIGTPRIAAFRLTKNGARVIHTTVLE